jgi:predicted ATP-grasp superfamily ATP-dependent carboligase
VGGGISALAAIRALGRRGIDVTLVTDEPGDLALRSRWCRAGHVLSEIAGDGEVLAGLLEERAPRWRGRVLLPAGDEALEALARHRDPLSRSFRVAAPPLEIVRAFLRKDLTYQAAKELGIEVARIYGPAERSTLTRDDIVYPVVVKPLESRPFVRRFGVKLFVARDREQLARSIVDLAAAGLGGLILDHIPGPDRLLYHYIVYIDARGEPTAEQAMRKLRASPPFYGVSRVVEPVSAPELREPTLELLRSLGWRGIAEASYKLDPRDGRFRLLELNGRCFTQQGLSLRCGLDYAGLAWIEAATGERPRAHANGWRGVWIHVHDDLYYGLFHRRVEGLGIGEYLAPYRRPKVYAVWSLADPGPSLAQWSKTLRRSLAASVDGPARERLRARVQAMPA